MNDGTYDSKLIKLGSCDYRLTLKINTLSKSLSTILRNIPGSKRCQKDIDFMSEAEKEVEKIIIQPQFFNYLKIALKDIMKQERRNANSAGFVLLDDKIKECYLEKSKDDWKLLVTIEGHIDRHA